MLCACQACFIGDIQVCFVCLAHSTFRAGIFGGRNGADFQWSAIATFACKLVSSRLTLYLCVCMRGSFARDFYRLQAVGDKIVEVDGLRVSDKSLLTYIVGTDTPDTFVQITVTSLPATVVRAHVQGLGSRSSYVHKCKCGACIFVQIHL